MGVGVSSWQLARAVAETGQLGVVSGTASAVTQARQLAIGDPGGHVRRALAHFPYPAVADRILARHLGSARQDGGPRFRGIARPTMAPGRELTELTVAANFVEVFLAKEGHNGPVGINYLEKIQLPVLASLYGAMLAGVDDVLVGAGVPVRFPALLDDLAADRAVSMPVTVAGAERGERHEIHFDPREVAVDAPLAAVTRPRFLAIVSSATMATYLARAATGAPDGFVVEHNRAGGHNAPPRGRPVLDEGGQPVYGPRDAIDLPAIAELGLPFWLAGGYATPERLAEARASGAVGVQVGTAFAFCAESGLADDLKRTALTAARNGTAVVRTDPRASPTGYPFKVLQATDTLSDGGVYAARPRLCDVGYLREPYRREDGRIGYRCPAEPVEDYVRKGGDAGDTVGRVCLCNALVTNLGLGQVRRDGYTEAPLLTSGDDVAGLVRYLPPGRDAYQAGDVIRHLLAGVGESQAR